MSKINHTNHSNHLENHDSDNFSGSVAKLKIM